MVTGIPHIKSTLPSIEKFGVINRQYTRLQFLFLLYSLYVWNITSLGAIPLHLSILM